MQLMHEMPSLWKRAGVPWIFGFLDMTHTKTEPASLPVCTLVGVC